MGFQLQGNLNRLRPTMGVGSGATALRAFDNSNRNLQEMASGLENIGQTNRTADYRRTGERGEGSLTEEGQKEYALKQLQGYDEGEFDRQAKIKADIAQEANAGRSFQTIQDKEGNTHAVMADGTTRNLGIVQPPKRGSAGLKKPFTPSQKIGMSGEAGKAFDNLSPKERLAFTKDDGSLKDNIAWVSVPETRDNKGRVRKKASGYFKDSTTGRRISVAMADKPVEKKEDSILDSIMSLF